MLTGKKSRHQTLENGPRIRPLQEGFAHFPLRFPPLLSSLCESDSPPPPLPSPSLIMSVYIISLLCLTDERGLHKKEKCKNFFSLIPNLYAPMLIDLYHISMEWASHRALNHVATILEKNQQRIHQQHLARGPHSSARQGERAGEIERRRHSSRPPTGKSTQLF